MNVNQQREALMKVYTGPAWIQKVKKMTEAQVTAIYLRLKSQGKLK